MDRLYCTIFMISVLYAHGVLLCAQEEIFLRSNALYNQQIYQEALQLYDTLNNKGAAVWYNMGQCAMALQQYGQARLFFERAQRTASRSLYTAIKKNVADIIDHVHCKEYSCTIDTFIARVHDYSRTVPLLLLQLIFLGVWISILVLMRCAWMPWRRMAISVGLGLLLCVALFLIVRCYTQTRMLGVVLASDTVVYAGPNEHYHEIGRVHEAECVPIIRKDGAWYNITADCGSGWVKQGVVTAVNHE